MIRFKKKFIFFKVSEYWFGYKFNFLDIIGLTAYLHLKEVKEKMYAIKQISFTVENELEESEDIIFSKFSKTVKVEVKQAEKSGVECIFNQDIKRFVEFYNDFAASRKIDAISERRLNEMGDYLQLSYALYNGVTIAAHSYLVDKESGIVRLMQSASKRLNETFDKQLAGRANKLLHYRDMLYFKERGFKVYDFGGYAENTTDKGLQGINSFQLSVGGQKIVCNNYSSYPYFLLKKIAGAAGLLGRA
ncbi:MAG: hypothetical protein ACQUYJ_16310 [Ferruginibacter sp.]